MQKRQKIKIDFDQNIENLKICKSVSQSNKIIDLPIEGLLSDQKIANNSLYLTSTNLIPLSGPLFNTSTAIQDSSLAEYSEGVLDLNQHLMLKPENTFFVRVNSDSMIDAGIYPGNLLVIDRSLRPFSGKIIIAVLNGELTVKRLFKEEGKLFLMSENTSYSTIEITQEIDFMIWGVVTNVIQTL